MVLGLSLMVQGCGFTLLRGFVSCRQQLPSLVSSPCGCMEDELQKCQSLGTTKTQGLGTMRVAFFLVVEPSKMIFLIYKILYPQKEDRILLYIKYHSIAKLNTTHANIKGCSGTWGQGLGLRVQGLGL